MNIKIKVSEIVEAMDTFGVDNTSYLNKNTGEIVSMLDSEAEAIEEGNLEDLDIPEDE